MPVINAKIKRAWRHADRPDRIHYIVEREDTTQRHMYADDGSAMYIFLDGELEQKGYDMPASAEE